MPLLNIENPFDSQSNNSDLKEEIVFGIDLGTSNSVISAYYNNKVHFIEDIDKNTIIPSIISFDQDKKIVTGYKAKKYPNDIIYSIKRLIGKNKKYINEIKDDHHIDLTYKDNSDNIYINSQIGLLTPLVISSYILSYLKELIEKFLETHNIELNIIRAVITVPAYFDEKAKNETKNAAILAGINVIRLVTEPVAAAFAYAINEKKDQGNYLIFDLGGGTFDLSILKLNSHIFKVTQISGNRNFGGDNIDNILLEYILQKIAIDKNIFNKLSNYDKQKLKSAVRDAKEYLLHNSDFTYIDKLHNKFNFTLTREEMNNAIVDSIDYLISSAKDIIKESNLTISEIENIILIGGSTKLQIIKNKLADIFGKDKILDKVDPDKSVSYGACLYAHNLINKKTSERNILLDIIPLSLSIELMGGITDKIIYRNSQIPLSYKKEFTTYADNQTGMDFHILQGEREMAEDCISIAKFKISGIKPQKAGIARVELSFNIDVDGILSITAKDKSNPINTENIVIDISRNNDMEEIKNIILDSYKYANLDMQKRIYKEKITEINYQIDRIYDILANNDRKSFLSEEMILDIESEIKKIQKFIDQKKIDIAGNPSNYEKSFEELKIYANNFQDIAKIISEKYMDYKISKNLTGQKISELK